jgi:hypothetical protein
MEEKEQYDRELQQSIHPPIVHHFNESSTIEEPWIDIDKNKQRDKEGYICIYGNL